jgi:hypothetical protein
VSDANKPGYHAKYLGHTTPASIPAGETIEVQLRLQNAGSFPWLRGGERPFRLGYQWYDANNQIVQPPAPFDFLAALPRTIAPDGTVDLTAKVRAPDAPGDYRLRWDMIHERVTWFSSQGDPGLVLPLTVTSGATAPQPPPRSDAPAQPVGISAQDVVDALAQHPTRRYSMRTHADIRRLVIHHTATPANISVQRIADFQVKQRDLPGISYHFCVTAEGEIFQTQYLETVAAHAGSNSPDSVGICLIGNFTSSPPPKPQLDAAARLVAQLLLMLGLNLEAVVGYSELVVTQSPGATWPQWKPTLLEEAARLVQSPHAGPRPAEGKPLEHYLLFWYHGPNAWAEWDLQGAFEYIGRFKPVVGFDLEEAKSAKYVTIVGGAAGVPATAEQILQRAGCRVERIDGRNEAETRQLLEQLAAEGKRFAMLA